MINGIKTHGNVLMSWRILIISIIALIIMMLVIINGVKCGRSLKFCENKIWIHSIDSYGFFHGYFGYWLCWRSVDGKRKIARLKKIVNRFKNKLDKTTKDANSPEDLN